MRERKDADLERAIEEVRDTVEERFEFVAGEIRKEHKAVRGLNARLLELENTRWRRFCRWIRIRLWGG